VSATPRTERVRLASAGANACTAIALSGRSRVQQALNVLFAIALLMGVVLAMTAMLAIIGWSLVEGRELLSLDLIRNYPSTINPRNAGYRPAIIGSLMVILGVVALIVPLGTGAAIYLEEFADKTKWWNRAIDLNIQNLAGIPSIVYGILGLAFIVRGPLSVGFVALAGSLTLALLVLPTVILAAREALRAVPRSIREGALALGATPWQTVRRAVLPVSIPGILTGVILAVARAIGEAAPLLLVGAVTFITFDPRYTEGGYTVLPVQIYQYAGRPQADFRVLAAAGVIVMLGFLLAMNSVAVWLRHHYEKKV
jgi:phosphate transport system permease protein